MRMYSFKTLSIISIWQTALATRNQAQAIEPLTNEQNVLMKHLSMINHSCQDSAMKFAGLDKMQWYIWLYIEYAKLYVRSQNDNMSYNEQKENFTKTISLISKKLEHVAKDICKLYLKECTDQTSADKDLEIIINVFEMTKAELSLILKDIDKCLTNLQSEKSAHDKTVKDAEKRNLPLKNIRKLLESHEKSNTDFCNNRTQQTYRESAEQFVEAIGTCISDDLEKEFESLVKDPTTKDKDTLYSRFTLAMQKLQGVLAYFYAYDDFKIINSMINSQEESVKVTLSAFLENKELEIKKLSSNLRDKAKDNEKSKEKLASECTKEQAATFNLDRLDFDEILSAQRDLRIKNANEQKIKMNINAIANILKGKNSDNEDKCKGINESLLVAFKTHLSIYRRLLLEIDANNKEKDLAHAEFIKIAIYLKHVMFKARKALLSLEKTNQHNISESDKIIMAKLPIAIAQAIGTVYALQKVRSDFFEEQARCIDIKTDIFYAESERLKGKIQSSISDKCQKSSKMVINDANPSTSAFTTCSGSNIQEANGETSNFPKTFRDSHRDLIISFDCMKTLRKRRLDSKETSDQYIKRENSSLDIDQTEKIKESRYHTLRHLGTHGIYTAARLRENDLEASYGFQKDEDIAITKTMKSRLVKILNTIFSAFLASAKKMELEMKLSSSENITETIYKQIRGQEQLAALVLSSFQSLEICSDIVLMIFEENKFIEKVQNTPEYKIALEKSREGRVMVFGNYLYDKLFGRQKGENQELDRAETEVFSALEDFLEVYADEDQTNDDTSVVTIKDDEKEEVTAFVEFILDCFAPSNGLRDVKEMDAKFMLLKSWIGNNTDTMHQCYALFSNKLKIKRTKCNSSS